MADVAPDTYISDSKQLTLDGTLLPYHHMKIQKSIFIDAEHSEYRFS